MKELKEFIGEAASSTKLYKALVRALDTEGVPYTTTEKLNGAPLVSIYSMDISSGGVFPGMYTVIKDGEEYNYKNITDMFDVIM